MTNYIIAMLNILTGRIEKSDRGATAVEYGIMVAAIAAVIIGVVITLGADVQTVFQGVVDDLAGIGGAAPAPAAG